MNQKLKQWLKLIGITLVTFFLVTCGINKEPQQEVKEGQIFIVSSYTILSDMVAEIGGEYVVVHNIIPAGQDPHEYEPLPEDVKAATDADLIIANGMNLEGGEHGWFAKLVRSVDQESTLEVAAENIEPMYLHDETQKVINPHAYLSPKLGIQMAEHITEILKAKLPESADQVEKNGQAYISKLEKIDQEYREQIAAIPEERRILMTSERAFQYMAAEYGLDEAYIWALDTEENGAPAQINAAIAEVRENNIPVLFVESNVDTRPMETISKETGVKIYEKPVYSDEIGKKGEDSDTYLKLLEHNLKVITAGLSK